MIKVLFLIILSSDLAYYNEAASIFSDPVDPFSDEFINAINSLNTTWKAKKNFIGFSLDNFKGQPSADDDYNHDDVELPEADVPIDADIPESFDAREAWPNCSSIGYIRDQGNCGSCWAFGAVEAMSDRICIHSGGAIQVDLSAEDVIACGYAPANGCKGGNTWKAWNFWRDHGIVTGGYQGKGCKPYPYPPCKHFSGLALDNCTDEITKRPECVKTCKPGYRKSYLEDKYRGLNPRTFYPHQIQHEIMTNGPVEATFSMYADFFAYGSGVYKSNKRNYQLDHSVRILGWGVENGVKYWLVANSWNTFWGDQGYFKILRGEDHCNIESKVTAALPKLPKYDH